MERTVYITYLMDSALSGDTTYVFDKTYGYSTAIHCNYINRLVTDKLIDKKISFTFPENEFPFLVSDNFDGNGWICRKLFAIVQVIDGIVNEYDRSLFKIIDVT